MSRDILITGAAGRIGSALVEHLDGLAGTPYRLHLADLKASGARGVALDITDPAACRRACGGIDTVVHLAADPSPQAAFEDLLPVNIRGTYNVFRAACDTGVRRVVFASSAQAVEGYPLDVQVRTNMPVRPANLYGVSKAFGEAAGAYFSYREGLQAVAVRIGAFAYPDKWRPANARDFSAWASPADVCALLHRCIEADLGDEPFAIAHGISNNRYKRLDLSDTRSRLSYQPRDDAFSVWNFAQDDAGGRGGNSG